MSSTTSSISTIFSTISFPYKENKTFFKLPSPLELNFNLSSIISVNAISDLTIANLMIISSTYAFSFGILFNQCEFYH